MNQIEKNRIPKIIHYCWFGGAEKSYVVQKCIKSWNKLKQKGYRIIEWNETNCDMNANQYLKQMYSEEKWAFVSDYIRLKVLNEYGGIYLDTDVFVYGDFEEYLSFDSFWGMEYDFAIGTAVIGAKKGSMLIKAMIKQYDDVEEAIINNGLVTDFFINNILGFKVNGRTQRLEYHSKLQTEQILLCDKSVFNRGRIFGKSCSIHLCECSWGEAYNDKAKPWKKFILLRFPFFNYIAYELHKNAKYALEQSGVYQELYRTENENKN